MDNEATSCRPSSDDWGDDPTGKFQAGPVTVRSWTVLSCAPSVATILILSPGAYQLLRSFHWATQRVAVVVMVAARAVPGAVVLST